MPLLSKPTAFLLSLKRRIGKSNIAPWTDIYRDSKYRFVKKYRLKSESHLPKQLFSFASVKSC